MKYALLSLFSFYLFACQSGLDTINKAKKPIIVLGKRDYSCGRHSHCYKLICKDGNGQHLEIESQNLYLIYNVGDTIK
jgi:hypothetical protein